MYLLKVILVPWLLNLFNVTWNNLIAWVFVTNCQTLHEKTHFLDNLIWLKQSVLFLRRRRLFSFYILSRPMRQFRSKWQLKMKSEIYLIVFEIGDKFFLKGLTMTLLRHHANINNYCTSGGNQSNEKWDVFKMWKLLHWIYWEF